MRLAAILCTWICAATAAAAPLADGAFVRARDDRFVIVDGKGGERPAAFLGANFDALHGERRALASDTLSALAQDGLTIGRQWIVGDGPHSPSEWSRRYELVRAGPDRFLDEPYRQLDRILAEARARGIRLILTLSNHWADYGGVPAYLRWAGLPEGGIQQEAFYSDARTRAFYRAALDRVLLRTSTVTGLRYIDDPAIFAWELMNESNVMTERGAAARRSWIVEMARYIKARDPNHMVSAGLLGYSSRKERAEWIRVHQLPEVDYCDSHLYPEVPPGGDAAALSRLIVDAIDDRAQLARFVIKKPMIVGEFSFRTDKGPLILGRPRAAWFRTLLSQVLRDGGSALVWIYEPFSGTPRNYGIYTDRNETSDVRAVFSALAPAFAAAPSPRNPRLRAQMGEKLLYDPLTRLTGSAAPQRAWQVGQGGEAVLPISPDALFRAEFERAGVWTEGALVHAYGADSGFVEYRFAAPPGGRPPRALRIEARLSSEWPGSSAPPDGGSDVRVLVDGVEIGRLQVMPDDGLGRPESVTTSDGALLPRLAAGVHTLRFEVAEGAAAHGLTIYGAQTGKEKVPDGKYGPIRVLYLP